MDGQIDRYVNNMSQSLGGGSNSQQSGSLHSSTGEYIFCEINTVSLPPPH